MAFWIVAGLLTVLATAMVLLPLVRARKPEDAGHGHDKAIYQARLEEIDRDLELGRIDPHEAEAAKAEEARRLIQASNQTAHATSTFSSGKVRLVIVGLVIFVPLASLFVYSLAGQPRYPDQQLAERMKESPEQQNINELLARAQAHLDTNPDDAKGWEVVAPIYMKLGRHKEAADALGNIIRLKGETPDRLADLAETLMFQSNGMITSDIKESLQKALELDPDNGKARFYMALSLQQENKIEEARAAWNAIIADNSDNERMVSIARQQLATMESGQTSGPTDANGDGDAMAENTPQDTSDNAPGNPTAEQVQDAAKMDAGSRTEMIEGMVAQLREKLKEDPKNKQGWVRLFRSYTVLGKKEEMLSALAEARQAFANDPEFMEYLAGIEAQMNKGARAGGKPVEGSQETK